MAIIQNGGGVYSTLGYNFSDPNGYVQLLSSNTQSHLNSMPPFLATWQAQDMVNGNATNNSNYVYNPVANVIIQIENAANSISSAIISGNVSSLSSMASAANTLWATANSFFHHTNRLSNVENLETDYNVPYYNTALALGRTAMYIVNQTDGIINTSPILGSFTSLLITPQVSANANVVTSDASVVVASITPGVGILPGTTSLTAGQITQIISDMSNTNTLLTTRQAADTSYFNNLKQFINNYDTTKQYTNVGETGSFLLTNFIGKPNLIIDLQQTNQAYYTNNIVFGASSQTSFIPTSNVSGGIVPSGVTAGTYFAPILTIDIYGRTTAAANTATTGNNLIVLSNSPTINTPNIISPTITGIATAPTPSTNTSNTQIATTAFVNPGASLSPNGYQKLPSGLIMQWMTVNITANPTSFTFPIAYSTACYQIQATIQSTSQRFASVNTVSTIGGTVYGWTDAGTAFTGNCFIFAIGA